MTAQDYERVDALHRIIQIAAGVGLVTAAVIGRLLGIL